MVGDTLKIADGLQQLRGLLALLLTQLLGAELYQIGAQHVLVVVAAALILPDGGGQRFGVVVKAPQGVLQRPHGNLRHLAGDDPAALQRHGRCGQQALVQLHRFIGRVGLIRHQADSQLLQQAAAGQQYGRTQDIEHRVGHSDTRHRRRIVQQYRGKDGLDDAEHRQQHRHADHIEHQMHHGRPLGVFVGADAGDQRRDAGTDVLAHDNGHRGGVADLAGRGQRLQNTHRGGGRLDDRRQHRAHQHAQQRVCKGQKQLCKPRHVLQPRHRGAHGVHAEHQRGKAKQNGASLLFPAILAEHIENDADQRQHRRKGGGLQQLQPHAAAVDPRQAQQPGRHRGAHVGAHDNIDSLPQGHQPGVHEAHHHDGGGR